MKKIADGEPWTMPATIDDPAILDEIGERAEGQGRRRVNDLRIRTISPSPRFIGELGGAPAG